MGKPDADAELEAIYGDLYRQYRTWRDALPWHARLWWEACRLARGVWRLMRRHILTPLHWYLWRRPSRALAARWHHWQHRHDPPLRCMACGAVGAGDGSETRLYALDYATGRVEYYCAACLRGENDSGISITLASPLPGVWEEGSAE